MFEICELDVPRYELQECPPCTDDIASSIVTHEQLEINLIANLRKEGSYTNNRVLPIRDSNNSNCFTQ